MKSRKNKVLFLLLLLLGISIGFAALSTTLKINGNTKINKNTWNIYWDVPVVSEGSVSSVIPDRTHDDGDPENTKLIWTVDLSLPGDFYEFTVDAVNAGSLDAMITDIDNSVSPTLPSYIKYEVTYADGAEIFKDDLLEKANNGVPTREKYKVRVEFLDTITNEELANIPDGGTSYTFTYSVTYGQADDDALVAGFLDRKDWDEIIGLYDNGNPTDELVKAMETGRTKTITLNDNTNNGLQARLRIANLSTPDECNTTGFSQTACGFVLEFSDIVTTHRMNYYNTSSYAHGNGEGTWGGWQYSDMRAYLNGGTYSHDNINYAGKGFIDTLPTDIRNRIIDTNVSSSSYHGGSPQTSMVTDKLYLFAVSEIYGTESGNENVNYDLLASKTRQLDYYSTKMDTIYTNNWGVQLGAAGKNEINPGGQYWDMEGQRLYYATRSAYTYSYYDSSFYRIFASGSLSWTYSSSMHGVSPAFRIAKVN